MPEYICPNCRGAFPALDKGTRAGCPWCGQQLDASYEGGSFTSRSVVETEDEPPRGLLQILLGKE